MIILALVGMLGIVMVLLVIFSFLSVAKQAEEDLWRLTGILEDSGYEDQQTMVGKGQITRSVEDLPENSLEMVRRASAQA